MVKFDLSLVVIGLFFVCMFAFVVAYFLHSLNIVARSDFFDFCCLDFCICFFGCGLLIFIEEFTHKSNH